MLLLAPRVSVRECDQLIALKAIDRQPEKRGVEKRGGQRPAFKGRGRAIVNQSQHWNRFKGSTALEKPLRVGVERIRAFLPSWPGAGRGKLACFILKPVLAWEGWAIDGAYIGFPGRVDTVMI